MPKLIKNSSQVENPWELISKESNLEAVLALPGSHLLVPAQLWKQHKAELLTAGKTLAVWLDSDETAELISDDLAELELIALNFPTFMDGRAYSTAAVLRQHYQYQGELRAIGDVLRDQLFFMKRCGFDSFDISDAVKTEDAMNSFGDFTDNYQSTIERPEPLFRRR